ncbi:MAG TPA: SRPBCC domain-containing protein [Streptosporangiaceae bacterium]|nr:SRPBCC domain-containing protein [Streptosporangiaceae bacterium]
MTLILAILVILGGYATWTNTRPYTLQAWIQIAATPQRVWAVLTDLPAYQRWNPFIVSSSGRIQAGATLTNRMHDATGDTTFTPTILVAEPARELRWIGEVGPGGLFDGEHAFTIQQLRPGLIRFTQREDFTGAAIPFFESRLHADTLAQFRAMERRPGPPGHATGSWASGHRGRDQATSLVLAGGGGVYVDRDDVAVAALGGGARARAREPPRTVMRIGFIVATPAPGKARI